MDLTGTIEADSTQINADDVTAPRIVTITGVSKGTPDQPVNIELAEFPGRSYRPCKSMRRMLVHAWGPDASKYVGRRMQLYNDQTVKWGGQTVGGIRISALSHIDMPVTLALLITRGKRAPFRVEPLKDTPSSPPITDDEAADFARDISDSSTIDELDAVATALKSCNLGTHHKPLLDAWKARKTAIEEK